jgi:hypothetical protein
MGHDQPSMWLVRAGIAREADSLFLEENCVTLVWVKMLLIRALNRLHLMG